MEMRQSCVIFNFTSKYLVLYKPKPLEYLSFRVSDVLLLFGLN